MQVCRIVGVVCAAECSGPSNRHNTHTPRRG
jgi:hypothetical protein